MKTVCVYCGSSDGREPLYSKAARQLGEELLSRDIGLVYGGASIGMMGTIADTVLNGGGRVVGVIPQALAKKEVAHLGLTEMHIVSSMHERKAKMAEQADGFIAMPGGLGTLEELFEIMTWAQLGLHTKPCGLLNIQDYYDHLIAFLKHAVAEQFVKPVNYEMLLVANTPAALMQQMAHYQSPLIEQVIESSET